MNDRRAARSRSRWWLALALAATGTIAAITVLQVWGDTPGGVATLDEAVATYVDALNRNDAEALRQLSIAGGPSLETGINRRLAEYGGRSIRLTHQDMAVLTPTMASARLTGTIVAVTGLDEAYQERLQMNRHEDRWYVNLHYVQDLPPQTGVPPLPTAGVDRPG